MIWFKPFTIEEINSIPAETMISHLGIVFTEIGEDFLKAEMPVDKRTIQPAGLLHGGASLALAESIGSLGAHLTIDPEKFACVGLEINGNHIKSIREGFVIGTGKPIHLGKSTQVWEIIIQDRTDNLIAVCRITLAVLQKK